MFDGSGNDQASANGLLNVIVFTLNFFETHKSQIDLDDSGKPAGSPAGAERGKGCPVADPAKADPTRSATTNAGIPIPLMARLYASPTTLFK